VRIRVVDLGDDACVAVLVERLLYTHLVHGATLIM
jgi:hypothetical protein